MAFRIFLKILMQLCVLVAVALPAQAVHMEKPAGGVPGHQMETAAMMPECGIMCDMSAAECALHLQCADHKIIPFDAVLKSAVLLSEFNVCEARLSSLPLNPAAPPPRFV
ncbi:MAG: hypothetical protein JJ879_04980 [Sneathiella sp.]|nr:hypothetical protein [Sneathiella sp.]